MYFFLFWSGPLLLKSIHYGSHGNAVRFPKARQSMLITEQPSVVLASAGILSARVALLRATYLLSLGTTNRLGAGLAQFPLGVDWGHLWTCFASHLPLFHPVSFPSTGADLSAFLSKHPVYQIILVLPGHISQKLRVVLDSSLIQLWEKTPHRSAASCH